MLFGIHIAWDGVNWLGQRLKIFESNRHIDIEDMQGYFSEEEWKNIIGIRQEKFIGYDDKIYWRLVVRMK